MVNNTITNKTILKSISLIKKSVRETGVKKAGKSLHGGENGIYSEAQLINLFEKHSEKLEDKQKIEIINTASTEAHIYEMLGKLIVTTISSFTLIVGDEIETVQATGIGSDRNDASFAHGKALTYSKRYFYAKLLGLSSADIEPENKEQALKEVKLSLKTKIELDSEKVRSFLVAFKEKFNLDFNINSLSYEDLIKYDNQL